MPSINISTNYIYIQFIIFTAKHQIFGSSSSPPRCGLPKTTTGQRSKFQALNRIPPTERSYNIIIVQIPSMLLDQIIAWRSIGERERQQYSTVYFQCHAAKISCSPVTFIKLVGTYLVQQTHKSRLGTFKQKR